jgi:hypothetical protein
MRISKKLKGLIGRQAYCPSASANSLDVQTVENELAILENRFLSSISNTPTASRKRPLPTNLSPMNLAWLDLMQKPAKSPRPAAQVDADERLLFIHFVGTVQTRSPSAQPQKIPALSPQVQVEKIPALPPQVQVEKILALPIAAPSPRDISMVPMALNQEVEVANVMPPSSQWVERERVEAVGC